MNIPLINSNGVNDINTSIIAIKRQEEQLNDLIKVANNKIVEADNKIKLLNNLLDSLNLSEVGGSGKFIQSVAQEKGLLSASAGDIATSVESGNSNPVTSGAVATALSSLIKFKEEVLDLTNITWSQAGTNGIYYINIYPNLPQNAQLLTVEFVTWDSQISSNKTLTLWVKNSTIIYLSSNTNTSAGHVTIRYIYI